jgi:hypothetical protein
MKKHLPACCLLLVLLGACKKSDETDWVTKALNDCIESSVATNPEHPNAEFAQFRLNGKEILFNDGQNGYEQFCRIAQTFTTAGPILDPGTDSSRQFQLKLGFDQPNININDEPVFEVYSPKSDQIYIAVQSREQSSMIEFIDRTLHVGDLKLKQMQSWESSDTTLTEGFEINYWCKCACEETQATLLACQSTNPRQSGYLRCTRLDRTDMGDAVAYHVEFEMSCDLYLGGSGAYAGKLEHGRMVADFIVDK